jgi:hypothetical protein
VTIDYQDPAARLALLLIKQNNVTTLPVVKKVIKRKFKNTLSGLGDRLEEVAHTETKEVIPVEDVTITSSDQLTSLLELSLRKHKEILMLEPKPTDENYVAILRIQASVCEKIMSTQTKVDENVLRARNDSRLGDILAKIQEAKKELNLTVVVSSSSQDQ